MKFLKLVLVVVLTYLTTVDLLVISGTVQQPTAKEIARQEQLIQADKLYFGRRQNSGGKALAKSQRRLGNRAKPD